MWKRYKKRWINVDKINYDGVDVVHDLNKFPYPFHQIMQIIF